MGSAAGKIKHALPIMRAPNAAEIAASRLFSPCQLASGLELFERSWVPAMVPWRATDDGFVTPAVLDWYGRFAEGEPGVIVVEATGIRDVPSGPLLRIGHDRFLPGLRSLVERVREKSAGRTRLFIQCIDFLQIKRRPPKDKFIQRFLRIDDLLRRRVAMHAGDASLEGAPEDELRAHLAEKGPNPTPNDIEIAMAEVMGNYDKDFANLIAEFPESPLAPDAKKISEALRKVASTPAASGS